MLANKNCKINSYRVLDYPSKTLSTQLEYHVTAEGQKMVKPTKVETKKKYEFYIEAQTDDGPILSQLKMLIVGCTDEGKI